jgi:hypothetical protein
MRREMSDTGLMVLGMTEPLRCYDVTVTVNHNGSTLHQLADFAAVVRHAASRRGTSIMRAHTARQLISIVTVPAADQPAAVAVALAVVAEALEVRSCRPAADGTVAADLMRWLVEPGVPVVLGAARPAP